MERPDDREVLRAAAAAIREARRTVPEYARTGASSDGIALLLADTDTVLVERRFVSAAKGMAFARIGGGHVIEIDTACTRADAHFTVRHELGHVIRGEATEPTYLTSEDVMSHSERVADLFALADLTPGGLLSRWTRGKRLMHATSEAKQMLRASTEGWSDQRIADRAMLRVLLLREHGI